MEKKQDLAGQGNPPRRWYRPQFSLLTMFYVVTWVAVAASLNLGTSKIEADQSKMGYYFRASRGYPFEYLSIRSRDYHPVPPLDERGWPTAEPLPFASSWMALAANAVTFFAAAVAFLLTLKVLAELASVVQQALNGSRDTRLWAQLAPSVLLIFLGLAAAYWAVWYFAWINRYYGELALSNPSKLQGWPVLRAGLSGGIIAICAGRIWLRRFSAVAIALAITAIGLLAIFTWTVFSDGRFDAY